MHSFIHTEGYPCSYPCVL